VSRASRRPEQLDQLLDNLPPERVTAMAARGVLYEPMTYTLRGGFEVSSAVQWVTSLLLAGVLVPSTSEIIQGCC